MEFIRGWSKLNFKCDKCGKEHADIQFTIGQRNGERIESYHWACLPPTMKRYYETSSADMIAEVQTPFGTRR